MPKRSHDAPITVVNRFDVKGDTGRFERAFRDHSQYLRTREDFHFLVTVQLVEHPQVYVHLGHWRTMRGFLDTVHDDTFQAQVRKLAPMVDTEADQAVSVVRTVTEDAVVGAANVVLTRATVHGDPHVFERQFAETNQHLARLGGFGGSDLLRSTLRPDVYTAIQWWRDSDACERALDDSGHRAAARMLARNAELSVERTRHVAYERVLS
ncbi:MULTISPECIES: antibiotic biosynthesis monooxygenase family protein [Streptomyces]|uniref:antibiotic biosynthesis monooxygenase family protein n=1 Tax=Streptomyces TaxID=1883 RepID=UPI0029A0A3A0|nr:antibiotic biosynthesis monooxygenase [Streptomyces sp. ND04-05B]MDX3062299.1 antibiotic biosynthesis monooxygenase [Streptomyces sp. ND04-05B]